MSRIQCAECEQWFDEDDIEYDDEIGSDACADCIESVREANEIEMNDRHSDDEKAMA